MQSARVHSLGALASCYTALGQHEDAFATARTAVELAKETAAASPEAADDLCNALLNLVGVLDGSENWFVVPQLYAEVLQLLAEVGQLIRAYPTFVWRGTAIRALSNVDVTTDLSSMLKLRGVAAELSTLSVELSRFIVLRQPSARGILPIRLHNHAVRLLKDDRPIEALAALREALELRRALPEESSGARKLAKTLTLVGHALAEQGQLAKATEAAQEARACHAMLGEAADPEDVEQTERLVTMLSESPS
jgi:tetratricopeptide (TPR) repeat protein